MESQVCPLSHVEYDQIREIAYRYCGIDLRSGKEELVKARLGKKLRQLGLASYREYCDFVNQDQSGEALVAMVDALTTNHTYFFREPQHFTFFKELLRSARGEAAGRDFRIWSSACSTGEEPYSIAFTMLGELGRAVPGCIVATDISTRALAIAEQGRYAAERFQGLSLTDLSPCLLKGRGEAEGWYKVKPELRRMVEFRRLNLMEIPAGIGTFQVIFCRNVMIYFDVRTQESLVANLEQHLEPGGYLLIGHAESLNNLRHGLQFVRPAIYRKPLAGAGSAFARGARR